MIAFLNPHATDFLATPVSFVILRRHGLKKYGFLFDQMIGGGELIIILIDGTLSSLIPDRVFNYLPYPIRYLVLRVELQLWIRINKLKGKVKVHYGSKTPPSVKALFLFSYKDCVGCFDRRRKLIESFPLILIHLSHYMIRTTEKAYNISRLPHVVLVGDSDISGNSYFKKHFPWYHGNFLVLPFRVASRFKRVTAFKDRKLKCVATGSFHDLSQEVPVKYYQDFMAHFGIKTYHPTRQMLYENRHTNDQWLTCHISPYRERTKNSSSRAGRLIKHFRIQQKRYFSVNMVDEYNDHCFAVVGEEASGFPALGAFEAMGCGAVLLARSEEYYRGLGMEAGKHYLVHDGTAGGIQKIVHDLEMNPDKFATIAHEGHLYVDKFMRGHSAFDRLNNFIQTYGKYS